ncbi:MAG: 3-deoxy-7-phosphoheptulonate synthase, partial [Burkholderiales bacterium]|nr:3-deoxy-7-phosphoheptulonate synthase [Burkholderiales bacterium]
MILILGESTDLQSDEYRQLMEQLAALPNIKSRVHHIQGTERSVTEIYLIGDTKALQVEDMQALPCVEQAIRVSQEYRILGRHRDDSRPSHFEYQGLRFGQDTLHVFAGLCAVDSREHVEQMMRALQDNGQTCARM